MNWHSRILIIFLVFFAFLYYVGIQVLPTHSYSLRSKFIDKKGDKIAEYNDDKINTVITNITSSTPISIIATSSQYIKLDSKYTIPPQGKVILANLDNKTITLIQDNISLGTYNIVSIGKPNKYYETPGGIYKIKSWETSHFSSIGHVYMPWSMQFSGNYFIHGIPYYEDGERVSSEYSGGCIRMEDDDAEAVYDFSDKSTYVIVLKNDDVGTMLTNDNYDSYGLNTATANYKDRKYIALDIKDNMYYSNITNLNETLNDTGIERLAIVMTSLDNVSQEKTVTYKQSNVKQLSLLPELLAGDADATAETINPLGNKLFQAFLNNKVKSIGLENTEIDISPVSSTSTLLDLMYIYRYMYIYKPYLLSLDNDSYTPGVLLQVTSGKYNVDIIKDNHKDYLIIHY